MNTVNEIWVPTYYQQKRRLSWLRAAGGPQAADWLAGAVVAALVLGMMAYARSPQHQEPPSTTVMAQQQQ
jgi:hypothetical protein